LKPERTRSGDAPGRYLFIDGLRGIAALAVALLHTVSPAAHDISPSLGAVLERGRLGVEMFFVISGLVIALNISRSAVTLRSAGQFLGRRVIRLDPPYWASMIVAIAVAKAASIVLPGHPFVPIRPPAIFAHLAYLQYILGIPSISDVYWTLCFEIQFYLILTVLIALTQRLEGTVGGRARYFVFFPTLVLSALFATNLIATPRGACFGYWYAFLVGVAASWVLNGQGRGFLYFTALAAVGISAATKTLDGVVTAATGMLVTLAYDAGALKRWLSGPVFQFLGKISYSLYLIHWTIGGHLTNIINRLVPGGPYLRFVNALVGLGMAIVAAEVMWRLVERPSILLSRSVAAPSVRPQPL
jgi:peptidoglycan/LPS O-acetylase OafA/YrhL